MQMCTQDSVHACRQNSIRLLADKWLNLPDRPVSGGYKSNSESRHGMDAMREIETSGRGRVKDGRDHRGGESDKQRQRGTGQRKTATHEGKRVAVGRQRLEG